MTTKNIDGIMHEIKADDGKVLILLDGTETSLCYVPIDYPVDEIKEIDEILEEDADNEQII